MQIITVPRLLLNKINQIKYFINTVASIFFNFSIKIYAIKLNNTVDGAFVFRKKNNCSKASFDFSWKIYDVVDIAAEDSGDTENLKKKSVAYCHSIHSSFVHFYAAVRVLVKLFLQKFCK